MAEPRPGEPVPAEKPRGNEPAPGSKSRPGEPAPAESGPDKPAAAAESGQGEPVPAAGSRPSEPVPIAEPRPSEPSPAPKPFSVWEKAPKPSQEHGRVSDRDGHQNRAYQPEHAEPPSADTEQKLEQLKDLYLTAQAIGEDALVKHFDELSQMQRSLINEFFEKAGLGPKGKSTMLGGDSAPDDASLPG